MVDSDGSLKENNVIIADNLGSLGVLGTISDKIDKFRKIKKKIRKNERAIIDLQNSPDIIGHLYDFRTIITKNYEQNEFRNL